MEELKNENNDTVVSSIGNCNLYMYLSLFVLRSRIRSIAELLQTYRISALTMPTRPIRNSTQRHIDVTH